MKKILYGVWVWSIAVLLLLNMPMSAQAAEVVSQGSCGDSLYWTLDSEGVLTVSGSGEMEDFLETAKPWGNQIRRVVVEEGVQSIGPGAFYGCQLLESVSLPESVTKIGASAFFYCESLEQITLPSELDSIGDMAFYSCAKLKSICLPEGITALGERCFYRCSALETAQLPDSLTLIGEEAFAECENLAAVRFPKNLKQIETCAFRNCAALVFAELPEGTASVGVSAFEGCTGLTGVSLPKSLTVLGASAFRGCNSLEQVVIPEGIVTLEPFVFASCDSLKSVVLPQTLTAIGRYALNACNSLEQIRIPQSVTQMGEGVFAGCKNLRSLEIPEGVTRLETWFASNCDVLESVSLPKSLTYIGDYAFQLCPRLEQIALPEGLVSLGSHAFRECDSLESLDIPDSVTSIGEYTFFECDSLRGVRLPQNLTAIPAGMFEGCVSLERIDIPQTVTSIGHSVFVECESLQSVTVPQGVTKIEEFTFNGCIRLKQVALPEGVTGIDECAFAECESLGQLILPESVTYVGYETFRNCLSLEEMILPEGIGSVFAGTFYNCINLKRVQLPQSVVAVGDAAFYNCINLTEVALPDGIKSIGTNAFTFCTGLKNLVLPEALTYLGQAAFAYCNALEQVEIPASAQTIGMGAFYACTGLKSVHFRGTWKQWQSVAVEADNECLTGAERSYLHDGCLYRYENGTLYLPQAQQIPENFMQDASWDELRGQIRRILLSAVAVRIGENAFSELPQLEGIYLGSQVTDIHPDAFRGCPKLVIHGQAESYAQSFAQTNGIGFSTEHDTVLLASGAASCEEDGFELRGCTVCGWEERLVTQEKLGHAPLPILGETPLCMRVGLTEGSGCGTCGKILREQTVLPMDPDSHYYEGIRTEPTCTEDGYTVFTCVLCGHSYVGNRVAASHRYIAAVTNPTCTEAGFTTYTCHCGDSYTDNVYPAMGHREHSDIVIPATCTQSGLMGQTVCTVCGAVLSQEQQIPPTGHAWDTGTVTQKPTEDTQGVRVYTCGVCRETKTESIPVLEHSHSYRKKVTAPGCTEEGYTTYTCSCGDSYTADRVAALGHDVIIDEAEPPACGWFGLTEGSYCGRCGIVLVEQQIIPPTEHSWGQWVETVAPDATNDGENTRMCTVCGETETQDVDNNIFTDVKKDRFEEAILWAYYNGITTGTGDGTTFSPENTCTRKQIVTFLWRAAGEPEPKSMENPFVDVKQDRFEKAILWAYYEGITTGTGDGTTFSPENTCTRKQIVTFLWRYNGEPAPESMENPFVDVKNDRFAAAILWAAEQGITTGTGDGSTFSPENPCTRKQIVTFLYRDLAE